jgi:hypothetical protein
VGGGGGGVGECGERGGGEDGDWAVGSRRRCPCLTRHPQQLPSVSVSIPASGDGTDGTIRLLREDKLHSACNRCIASARRD